MRADPRWPIDLQQLHQIASHAPAGVDARVAGWIDGRGVPLPLFVFTLGSASPLAPALGVFGGVHGLERIGTAVAIAWLRSLIARLRWDDSLRRLLESLRLVCMPLVNPGGLLLGRRGNPNGVDLMRNAPVECDEGALALIGGQRLGAGLPWFRGAAGAPMEAEAQALCDLVDAELIGRQFAMVVDCHSGFGLRDRLWFPHAHTRRPIEHLPELQAFADLLDESLLHHRYLVEPQSHLYLAHGDLWDHLYLRSLARGRGMLLPLTLEMGSWVWVKKNPRQLFSRHGFFNPSIEHREQRVLRRHLQLFDVAMRAAASHRRWLPDRLQRQVLAERAADRWYRGSGRPR